jgi:hypothetical protein
MSKADTALFVAFEELDPADTALAEKNLMRAIIRLAMSDMHRTGERYNDARRFFLSNDDRYVFSFFNICRTLKLCPRTVRVVVGIREARDIQKLAA